VNTTRDPSGTTPDSPEGRPDGRVAASPSWADGEPWYSFASGPVFFIMFSTEHDWTNGSPQWRWMDETLSAVDRDVTPWIVIGGHRPMYTSEGPAPGDHLLSLYMREHMDSMLAKHKVNLMLTGHYHSYQRSCAVLHSECAADGKSGTVHVVVGTAGGTLDTYYNATWPQTDWSKQTFMGFGFSKVVANRSKLVFTYNATKTAQLLDSVTLDLWD